MSDARYIACIDAGTTGCRTIIFTSEGTPASQAYEEYRSIFVSPTWIDHDPVTWIQAARNTFKQALREFSGDPADIAAIGVISQRATFIPVDADGSPLDHAILWQDKRATPQAEMICQRVGHEYIYRKTGLRIDPYFSLPKLLWIKEHKSHILKNTHKILAVHDLILHDLTGEFVTDWTQASRTMLFNITDLEWDPELCEQFELPIDILPKAVPPGTVVGTLQKNLQAEFNVLADIPVVAIGGDQQAAAVGLGVIAPGLMCVNTGTGSFILAHAEQPAFDEQRRVVCTASAVAGKWLVEASIFTSGAVYRWFRDQFGMPEKNAAKTLQLDAYDMLNSEVDNSTIGSHGLLLMPHFAGSAAPYWDPNAMGLFFGLSLGHTRADVVRAILEGICFEIEKNIRIIETLTTDIAEVRVSGGATRFTSFNQIQANVYGKTVLRGMSEQSSALGAMLVAATGVGLYPDIATAVNTAIAFDARHRSIPDDRTHRVYEAMTAFHDDLYTALSSCNIYAKIRDLRELIHQESRGMI
jgi:xylulokinase/glycerol kinase